MGDYNPYTPQILGQEWVPIRDESLVFSPSTRSLERGHRFTLSQNRTLGEAKFYINDWPPGAATGQTMFISVYPAGTENMSGPIRRVVIPVNNGSLSGAGAILANGAISAADAVADPSDQKAIGLFSGNVGDRVGLFFDTGAYAQQLQGKRILGVNLLYTISGFLDLITESGNGVSTWLSNDAGQIVIYGTTFDGTLHGVSSGGSVSTALSVERMYFGEVNSFWSTTLSPNSTTERQPWNYATLARMEAGSASRFFTVVGGSSIGDQTFRFYLHYAAMEVLYCEEQRVAIGGKSFGYDSLATGRYQPYVLGANAVTMRTVAQATNPVLTPGEYTITLTSGDPGYEFGGSAQPVFNSLYPDMNAVRQLYEIPPHAGVQINVPFPIDDQIVDKYFTVEHTQILPQLSLHTSGGPLTEVHVYGRQVDAPVYGAITATQTIQDDAVLSAAEYPWVRFYARRFGDTTQPLVLSSTTPTLTGSSVSISVPEFDALDEVLDGWKEVSLRFTTAPTMGALAGNPTWVWSSAGELAGNQWQVLGASAPALSGIPGDLTVLVPSPGQLGIATYGAPVSGAGINLSWLTPAASAVAADPTSDAVLIFGQDPPTVSGFGVSMLTQAVSGIGQNCGIDPCCIPNGIFYHQLTWDTIPGGALDRFTRTETDEWGDADYGGPWTMSGGAASDYSVDGASGQMIINALNSSRKMVLSTGSTNTDDYVLVSSPVAASGAEIQLGLMSRFIDASNYYRGVVTFQPGGALNAEIVSRVGGSETNLATNVITGLAHVTTVRYWVRFITHASSLLMKVWPENLPEPDFWHAAATDTSLTTGDIGTYARINTGNMNTLPVTFSFDDFQSEPHGFGAIEIQRMDQLTPWQTVMRSTTAWTSQFNDFEARVGLESLYRIRQLDVYDFPGEWSQTVTATLTSPGITGGDCVTSGGHILIFTSNQSASGAHNLAYSSVWEGRIAEDFTFPEAGEVQLQRMYGRDYVVAFRPRERGGARFNRTLLVQAAAISPATLPNFINLRDLAWADIPYVCVRDEDGNRWFATVLVPSGRIMLYRQLYMAPVDIIEVTDTANPVDP